MPALQAPAKVLVTGASGFLAVWVVKTFLDRGFSVRGTVRATPKGEYVKKLFEKDFPGKFEYVVVPDIEAEGAFDEAVKGVDGIAHTASPLYMAADGEPAETIINPAVNGTITVLKSALEHGKSVKRIVVTGSIVSVFKPNDGGYFFTDKDWNTADVEEVKEKGAHASPMAKYNASKTLAERAVWDFLSAHPAAPFDTAIVMPGYIYGPVLHDVKSSAELNLTTGRLFSFFVQEVPAEQLEQNSVTWIDVRDVADVHVDALEKEELGGQRLLMANTSPAFQDFYDAANSIPKSELPPLPFAIPVGKPGAGDAVRGTFPNFDKNAERLTGRTFRPLKVTIKDFFANLAERKLI